MKKFVSLVLVVLLLSLSLTGCGGGAEEASVDASGEPIAETYNWRFAHEEINGSAQDLYVKQFVELLSEKSDGRINVEIYPVGQIGDATQQTELLQNGGIEFCIVSPGNTGTIVPENQLFSLHFLFLDDMDKNMEVFRTSKALNEDLSAIYLDKNIKVLSYWPEGFMQWTSSQELQTPEDFAGFKMRTMPSPMIVAAYETYGANPTPLPYMEVYSGLQLKMIEGQENPLFCVEEMKFYEVQDYLTLANSSLYVTTTSVNPDFFNGLPADIQDIILETADEMFEYTNQIQEDLNSSALDKIVAASEIEIRTLSVEERAAFIDASQPARDTYKEMVGANGATILDKLIDEIAVIDAK
jgi:tripartite ATP-independent transporter DctP family solute receptor